MKTDNIFLLIMIIGVVVILSTGFVRAATTSTTEFCTQNTRNPLCTNNGLAFEKPFTVESAHVTLVENCNNPE